MLLFIIQRLSPILFAFFRTRSDYFLFNRIVLLLQLWLEDYIYEIKDPDTVQPLNQFIKELEQSKNEAEKKWSEMLMKSWTQSMRKVRYYYIYYRDGLVTSILVSRVCQLLSTDCGFGRRKEKIVQKESSQAVLPRHQSLRASETVDHF